MLSVLRWTSGTLRREPMDRPIPADQALDLSTNRLLLLGMRLFPDAGAARSGRSETPRAGCGASRPRPSTTSRSSPRPRSARCSPLCLPRGAHLLTC